METTDEKIKKFLGINLDDLSSVPENVLSKMRQAINGDDYMELHSLGYELLRKEESCQTSNF